MHKPTAKPPLPNIGATLPTTKENKLKHPEDKSGTASHLCLRPSPRRHPPSSSPPVYPKHQQTPRPFNPNPEPNQCQVNPGTPTHPKPTSPATHPTTAEQPKQEKAPCRSHRSMYLASGTTSETTSPPTSPSL